LTLNQTAFFIQNLDVPLTAERLPACLPACMPACLPADMYLLHTYATTNDTINAVPRRTDCFRFFHN
jgi:hypothetical protein